MDLGWERWLKTANTSSSGLIELKISDQNQNYTVTCVERVIGDYTMIRDPQPTNRDPVKRYRKMFCGQNNGVYHSAVVYHARGVEYIPRSTTSYWMIRIPRSNDPHATAHGPRPDPRSIIRYPGFTMQLFIHLIWTTDYEGTIVMI